jgi:hypothetical protein
MEDVNGDEIDPGGVTVLVDCERQDDWSRSNGYREGTLEAYKGTSQVRRWREKATASVFLHQCEGIERYVQNMLDPVDVRRQLAEVLGSPGSTPRFGLWKGLN